MACSFIFAGVGESLTRLATRCGISEVALTAYNPSVAGLGQSLVENTPVCCTAGSAPDLPLTVTVEKTNVTERDAPGYNWLATLYSNYDCDGDYYSLEGYNDIGHEACLSPIQGSLAQTTESYDATCRWFTNGGSTWAPCSEGTMVNPRSSFLRDGVHCRAFDSNDCSTAFPTVLIGGRCYNRDSDNTRDWLAIKCGSNKFV